MVPLADIFNHKASVVLLDDAWGVAELADPHGHHADQTHSHDESSESCDQQDDSGDDVMKGAGHIHSHRHGSGVCGSDCPDSEHQHAVESEDGSEDGSEAAGSGSDSEDAQHGFAVGGMPIISAEASDGNAAGGWLELPDNTKLALVATERHK
jgi:hypothetical protein